VDERVAAELLVLEQALARRDRSAVPDGLPSLIDGDFEEFGASGRRWDRAAVLVALAEAPPDVTIEEFAAVRVGEDVVLVTFRTIGRAADTPARHALRSSLWVRRDGRWRLRFHQGTPTIGDQPPRT
jgi:glyoxylase I family protein